MVKPSRVWEEAWVLISSGARRSEIAKAEF